MQGKLDRLGVEPDLPRELLESLALRFEHANPDAPVPELLAFLKAKAAEWKELKARLAALEAEDPRIGNARAAAEAAIAAGDFDAADAVLAGAEELQQEHRTLVEVRRQAGLRQARAEALLLKGDADGAAAHSRRRRGSCCPSRRWRRRRSGTPGPGASTTKAFASAAPGCCGRSSSTAGTRRSGRGRRIRWTGR